MYISRNTLLLLVLSSFSFDARPRKPAHRSLWVHDIFFPHMRHCSFSYLSEDTLYLNLYQGEILSPGPCHCTLLNINWLLSSNSAEQLLERADFSGDQSCRVSESDLYSRSATHLDRKLPRYFELLSPLRIARLSIKQFSRCNSFSSYHEHRKLTKYSRCPK